eukprot:GFKZ01015824.1.p1 GENE.GFKZ01015824.1~~GFKZ01015824.1.p1  ORF type:complete len:123 (-),score=0.88 GFKZ01015824.1:718-1086(-)
MPTACDAIAFHASHHSLKLSAASRIASVPQLASPSQPETPSNAAAATHRVTFAHHDVVQLASNTLGTILTSASGSYLTTRPPHRLHILSLHFRRAMPHRTARQLLDIAPYRACDPFAVTVSL